MPIQITIDFDVVHKFENLPENQAHLECNRDRFNGQCWEILKGMLHGIVYTTKGEESKHIGDLRARVRDLIKYMKVPVKKEFVIGEDGKRTRFKMDSIDAKDRAEVAMRFINQLEVKKTA